MMKVGKQLPGKKAKKCNSSSRTPHAKHVIKMKDANYVLPSCATVETFTYTL